MVNSSKVKSLPSSFFIFCLIAVLHTPYHHFHIISNESHSSNHEHYSEAVYSDSENHSHNSNTKFSNAETFKPDDQNVRRHLHFTRELYRSRKNSQSDPEKYNSYAVTIIRPVPTDNHLFSNTLTDFHKIRYSPKSSKTFSGLSPPVA